MRFILEILKGSVTARHPTNREERAAVQSPLTQAGKPLIIANFIYHGNTPPALPYAVLVILSGLAGILACG